MPGEAFTAGLLIEYSPAGDGRADAVGALIEYSGNRGAANTAGVLIEYSEQEREGAAFAVGVLIEYKSFVITAISPNEVSEAGGTEITLTGTFSVGQVYEVDVDDSKFYSGFERTNDQRPVPTIAGQLVVVVPPLAVGVATVRATDTVAGLTATIPLTVIPETHSTTTFDLRKTTGGYPRAVGPTSIEET